MKGKRVIDNKEPTDDKRITAIKKPKMVKRVNKVKESFKKRNRPKFPSTQKCRIKNRKF